MRAHSPAKFLQSQIHRAGEGEPYTGLKPAGRELEPAIPAADKAIESGKLEPLLKILTEAVQAEVREKFKVVAAKKRFKPDDVEAGREYVEAYVPFVSYIERIYATAKRAIDTFEHQLTQDEIRRRGPSLLQTMAGAFCWQWHPW